MALKQLSLLTTNSIIGAGASYVFSIYLANSLGAELFGQYSYVLLISSLIVLFSNFSTDSVAPRMASTGDSRASIFSLILSFRISFLLVSWLFVIVSSCFLELPKLLVAASLVYSVAVINLGYMYEICSENYFYSLVYLGERLLYIVIALLLFYFFEVEIRFVFLSFGLATMLSLFVQFSEKKKFIHSYTLPSRIQFVDLFRYNFPLFLISISQFAYGGLSRILFEYKYGMKELAIYSLGFQLTVAISIFQSQVTKVYRLRLSSDILNERAEKTWISVASFILHSTIPVAIGAALVAIYSQQIVSILFENEYAQLADYLYLFAWFFVVINLHGLVSICWISIGRNFLFMLISLSFSVLLLVLLALLPVSSPISTYILTVLLIQVFSVIFLGLAFVFTCRSWIFQQGSEISHEG